MQIGLESKRKYQYAHKMIKVSIAYIVYTCDIPGCGKSYTTRSQLYHHQLKVHNIPKPRSVQAMKRQQFQEKYKKAQEDTHVIQS